MEKEDKGIDSERIQPQLKELRLKGKRREMFHRKRQFSINPMWKDRLRLAKALCYSAKAI
jgi:hypothetical protein